MTNLNKHIVITLLAKGAAVHFHRKPLLDALHHAGYQITFLCNAGLVDGLNKRKDCNYVELDLVMSATGLRAWIIGVIQSVRSYYPMSVPAVRRRHQIINASNASFADICRFRIPAFLASFRPVVLCLMKLEQLLVKPCVKCRSIESLKPDVVLTGGIGHIRTLEDGYLTIYCRARHIPVLSTVINYDILSAKGFRGCDVDALLVWGNTMGNDALTLQAMSPSVIKKVGAFRYNTLPALQDKTSFCSSQGLDPQHPILYFCGGVFPVHYFDMIELYKRLKSDCPDAQLVIRPYPSKHFLESASFKAIQRIADDEASITFNHSMTNMQESESKEFLDLEEDCYWNYLKHSSVILHYFSSVAIDSLLFNKSSVCVAYRSDHVSFLDPEIASTVMPIYIHHQRANTYGVIDYVASADEAYRAVMKRMKGEDDAGHLDDMVQDEVGPLSENGADAIVGLINSFVTKKEGA